MTLRLALCVVILATSTSASQLQRNLRARSALKATIISCTADQDCESYSLDVCSISKTAATCNLESRTCKCHCEEGYTGEQCLDFDVPAEMNNCSSTPTKAKASTPFKKDDAFLCNCLWGYAGEYCQIHGCADSDCNGHGFCAAEATLCTCDEGWTGGECARKKCTIGGKQGLECSGPDRGLCNNGTCTCLNGWTGSDCGLHGCGPNKDCSGNGGCNTSTSTCTCGSGWDGVFCSSKKCPAGQTGNGLEQCSERGQCTDGNCLCDCLSKDDCWLGEACEVRACPGKTVEGLDCNGQGTCDVDPLTSKYHCNCERGFYGDACSITCPQDCSGHGKCGKTGECACESGWIGLACDRTCTGLCQHGGTCNLKTGVCDKCSGKWAGDLCEVETCDPECHPAGTEKCMALDASNGTGSCLCKDGWVGATCQEKLCQDCFGKCTDGVCECGPNVEGFERHHGEGCSLVDCIDPDCSSHGSCNIYANASVNGGSIAGTCSCTSGFSGVSCEKLACDMGGPVDNRQECTDSDHGACVDGACQCNDGWAGSACERKECIFVNGKECNNQGLCLADGTCHCATQHDDMENLLGGWAGDGCQLSYCGIGAGPSGLGCSGHGKCDSGDSAKTGGLPTCACDDGWTLDFCQRKLCPKFSDMECGGNGRGTCDNVGMLTNTTNHAPSQYELTATCTCKDGFAGEACETMSCHEFEEAEVCNGHGTCDEEETSETKGTCINCQVGYAGAFCHLPTAVETDAVDAKVEIAHNSTYVNLIKQAETKAEAVVAEDDFAMKAARMKLAAQQAEAGKLSAAADALKNQKKSILNKIGSMMSDLKGMNKTTRELDPKIAKKTTPSKCVTSVGGERPQICNGHGKCGATDVCDCQNGWGSSWTSKSGTKPDDPLCASASCPDECSHQGRCIRGTCYCESGFSGLNCANIVCGEVCTGEHEYPVQNGGEKCECACTFGWEGKGCTTKIKSSCPDDCGEHGSCDKGVCSCMSNWSGELCQTPPCPTELKGVSCTGRGTCLESQECECEYGYTGKACNLLNCVHLNDCSKHGTCNNGTCTCSAGWGNDDCSEKVYPECPLGCSGIGECKEGKCFCPPGYYGNSCQNTYNMCTPENCNGHGTCNITVCMCNNGWKGPACETEIKACPNDCSNHGTCDTATGECSCQKEFTGLGCGDKACLNGCEHGKCANGTCACEASWEGPTCATRTCPDGCNGHGSCMPGLDGNPPFCKCSKDYSGSACEISAGGCMVDMGKGEDPVQCAGHGYCEQDNFCSCFVGWDPNNECKSQLCDPADCSGHGVCQDSGKCECRNGWLGKGCDTKACPRGSHGTLCAGHGSCNDATKECECEAGWCGENCGDVKKIDFPQGCMSNDATNAAMCSGHGACRQLPSPPGSPPIGECNCDDRYGGPDCSVAKCIDDCSGHGKCDELLTCQCNVGFGGESCKEKTCEKAGCVNGECLDGFCKCNKRWIGEDCSEALCPEDCNGHGTCEKDVSCQCVEGYTGLGCENAPGCVDECGKGQCTPLEGGGGKCKCPLGLDGVACEVELCPGTLTDNGACYGHGECTVEGDAGQCACDTVHGYSGSSCEKSRCPKGCSNNGICNEDDTCQCDVGFMGKDCSKIGCPKGFRNKQGSTAPCTEQYCSSNTPNDVTCGGKGTCSETEQKCVCEKGFWGEGCQDSLCTPSCENGQCRKLDNAQRGICVCDSGFSGAGCNIAYCGEKATCNDHGECSHKAQQCTCGKGYRGHTCEEDYCGKDAGCSGHGECNFDLETCKCEAGWSGEFCVEPSCGPTGDCSGHGICVQEGDSFQCDCMDGFEALDCHIKSNPIVSEKEIVKAAKAQANASFEKIIANGGTKEEAELAAKAVEQQVKAAAGEPPAITSSISLSVPLVLRGSAGDQQGVLTSIFQGMFKDDSIADDGLKSPMYELASEVNNVAIEVCKKSVSFNDASCAPRLSIPLQYAVSDMAREWCVRTPDGKCDVHTVKTERIRSIVQDLQSASSLLEHDFSSFDQVKSAILARKLYDALGVSPTRGNKGVVDATASITEHYAERFSSSVTVVEHVATLMIELAELDAPKDIVSSDSNATAVSRSLMLSKCEIATHALLQSDGKISPARGLLEQALIMHGVQMLSEFVYKQDMLVHLSKATMSLAEIPKNKPVDNDVMKSFVCLAKALLSLSKASATIQKRTPMIEDIDTAVIGLHEMAVKQSGVESGPEISEKLIDLCLTDELDRPDGPIVEAMAAVTPIASAKKLQKLGLPIEPEKMKKLQAAFAGNPINAIAHAIATAGGKCPNNW